MADRVEREALADRTAVLMSGAEVELPNVSDRLRLLDDALVAPFHIMPTEQDELMRELGLRRAG